MRYLVIALATFALGIIFLGGCAQMKYGYVDDLGENEKYESPEAP